MSVRCRISTVSHPSDSAKLRPRPERATGAPSLEFARAAASGLTDSPRWLPSRFLYDARGSALFEQITRQPEYYLTATEAGILAEHAGEISRATGPTTLVELGSGYSVKTSHLLGAYAAVDDGVTYVPVDVSAAALAAAAERIAERHPEVEVAPLRGRYEEAFPLLRRHSPCTVVFLGSTVGNFDHAEASAFFRQLAEALAPGDHLLLGVDLVKDPAVLHAAYNDAAGVTARFTKNLFARMNRELGAGIDLDAVEHVARYRGERQRIEIFARFLRSQRIRIEPLGLSVEIGAGERVMTEISRKFVLPDLRPHLAAFGFRVRREYTDARGWFAVLLLRRERGRR